MNDDVWSRGLGCGDIAHGLVQEPLMLVVIAAFYPTMRIDPAHGKATIDKEALFFQVDDVPLHYLHTLIQEPEIACQGPASPILYRKGEERIGKI